MKRILCLALLWAGLNVAPGEESALPTIFVVPLDGDASQIMGWQPALGEGLAEMLITELTKVKKFQVLESTALENLKDEIKLGDEGFVASDEKVQKGGWAAADFMFRGKVTRFGAKSSGIGLGGFAPGGLGNLGIKQNKADVRIDWRIVDTATRKVIATGQAVGQETGTGFDVGVGVGGHGGNISFSNLEFINSALGKATVKSIKTIMAEVATATIPVPGRQQAKEKAAQTAKATTEAAATALRNTPGKVLAVAGKGTLIVSLGAKHGFKVGDKLKLYETVDTKDDKGNVVFTEEKLAGEISLETVQDEKSKASYAGDAAVKLGWTVKAN